MQSHIATTPFGSRPMSLALVQAHKASEEIKGRVADKWQVYRDLCVAKAIIGTNDRALAVLSALLSFYPDAELAEENGLVVFPSNRQLSLRAHGMPDTTLRRHLASLVDAGLILRRDSPNGKRYAHKGRAGEIEEAFGLSLAPLLARSDEIAARAEQVREEATYLKRLRERITLQRRDIAKLIEVAVEEGAAGGWADIWKRFRDVVETIPRRACAAELAPILSDMNEIREEVDNALISLDKTHNLGANDIHIGRQQTESKPDSHFESEPAPSKAETTGVSSQKTINPPSGQPKAYPLGLVLKACPDIADYAADGLNTWRDLLATAGQVRSYLGVSASAYQEALNVMGPENASILIACILQRNDHIKSPGGYLRSLTEKAKAGELSIGSILVANLKTNSQPNELRAG